MILTPLQKLPKNVGDLGKLIVAKGFKKLPKVENIAQSGHTDFSLKWPFLASTDSLFRRKSIERMIVSCPGLTILTKQ